MRHSALLALCFAGVAGATPDLSTALRQGETTLDLRLRFESVEQDNALRDGSATTLRSRLGYRSQPWHQLSAMIEYEGIAALDRDAYNSGPGGNGQTARSVIADPSGNELNQAYLQHVVHGDTRLRLGRQRIIHDNARFIGNVGWRQNEQTYDALSLQHQAAGRFALDYAYLQNVNTIFFTNKPLAAHVARVELRVTPALALAAYGYWLDAGSGADHRSNGVQASGSTALASLTLRYRAEFARQADYADSRGGEDVDYRHLLLGLAGGGWSAVIGQESLGGDGNRSFTTPLATLHQFNGWADVFLNTPVDGLVDAYLQAGYQSGPWKFLAAYHQFEADNGSARYGDEIDFSAGYRCGPKSALLLKFADYRRDQFAVDTRRVSIQWDLSL